MKINKQKLKEINDFYSLFKKEDKEIANRNLLKEFWLKQIIKELEETDLLKSIEDTEEIKSAQFNIWNDAEDPNWTELEMQIRCKKKPEEFDYYEEFLDYENKIRSEIYKILDDELSSKISDFIMVYIER